jgi:alpha-glucosidase
MWKQGIDAGVNSVYVDNLYPKRKEWVTISILVGKDAPVRQVFVSAIQGDMPNLYPTEQKGRYYSAKLQMPDDEGLSWCFVLKGKGKVWYVSERGVTETIPPLKDCFFLKENLDVPEWVASSTCYQIFPDRFGKGDTTVGAKEGEYSFDGGQVKVLPFGSKPLPFAEGRCLDFQNGDLKGIEDKLDYLKGMGIDTLYLNPIGVSRTTHRYDCDDFFHVDEKLGGDKAFQELCAQAHGKGMRIIVDISINHTGISSPWIEEHPDFYYWKDGKPDCWQGVPTLPQLNYGCGELRETIYKGNDSVMRKFLRAPFDQDGWRLDVASELGRHGDDNYCHEVWREVRKAVKEENPEAYLVAEDWVDSSPHLQGDEWDGVMNYYGCSRPMRLWMGEAERFLSDGWGMNPGKTAPMSGTAFKNQIELGIRCVPASMRFFAMNLFDSHDTPRLSVKGKEKFAVYSGLVMLQYLLPGMPSTYYGDEVGLPGPYGTVEECRYPMEWDEKKWDERFVRLYHMVGEIRNAHKKMLSFGAWRFVYADKTTVAFARYDKKEAVVAVLNRSKARKMITLDNEAMGMTETKGRNGTFKGGKIMLSLEPLENCIVELSCL